MDLGLSGSRALVGGGSRGLGGAIAMTLASEGARVARVARGTGGIVQSDSNDLVVTADLSTREGPSRAVDAAVREFGGLDLLVVNSGGPPSGGFLEVTEEGWRVAVDGTLLSVVRIIGAALPHLLAGKSPAIVVVLSSSVREPILNLVTSNVLRPGLVGLIKSLLPEIAPVRINGIAPGRIATDRVAELDRRRAETAGITLDDVRRQTAARVPLGRYGAPDEVGRVATFLLSPAASYVNGAIVPVDGGMVRALP